ncbi:MAG: hypothetical protein RLZ55_370 [Actinomycetota bacterium]
MTAETLEIQRDRFGRPRIVPPDGSKPTYYTRVSTMAKTLEDTYTLGQWQQRQVIRGLALKSALVDRAITAVTVGDAKGEDPKAALQEIVDEAHVIAGSSDAAEYGTSVHAWAEYADFHDHDVSRIPADMRADVAAYRLTLEEAGVVPLEAETFVVCDRLRCAGSFDRLYRMPDGAVVIGDIKTGSWGAQYGTQSWAIQLAIYANSMRYLGTKEREALHADLDLTRGLLVTMPARTGSCALHELDLVAGWEAAQVAHWVRAYRKQNVSTALADAKVIFDL